MKNTRHCVFGTDCLLGIHRVIAVLIPLFCAAGCDRVASTQRSTNGAEIDWYNDYTERYMKQLQRAEQQANQVDVQQARFDAILAKWEKNAERVGALLDRWDAVLADLEKRSGKP